MARRPNASDDGLIELFLDMQAAERGAGENTLAAYRNDLADLSAHLRASGATIAKADTEDLRGFLKSLDERGFKPASLARRLSAVRQLYRFLYAEGKRTDDPAAVLEGPKRGRSLPKVLTIAEVDKLLAQARANADNAEQPPAQRLRAARLLCLLEVVYATGLRVSELVALPASAARRDQRMLVVRGKGGKERLVPLNKAAKQAMAEYLSLRAEAAKTARTSKKTPESKWLFPVVRRDRPSHPPAFRPRPEGAGRILRHRRRAALPARAAPCLRQPPSAQRRRPARGADPARPRRHLHHPDLHPCAGGSPEDAGARPAPTGRGVGGNLRKTEINRSA